MKFGKEIDAISPVFDLPCLPYKRMKKVLKFADEARFFDALQASLRELEDVFKVALARVVSCSDNTLVIAACRLASWVQLQRIAVRKIIKKCDKRHALAAGAAWLRTEYNASTLFGASSEMLQELLVSLSLDERGAACVDPLCCISGARVLVGMGGGAPSGSDDVESDADDSSDDGDDDDDDAGEEAGAVEAFGFFSRRSFRRDYLDAPDAAAPPPPPQQPPPPPPPPRARTAAEDAALREAALRRMGALDEGRCAPGRHCGPEGCAPRAGALPKRPGSPEPVDAAAAAKRARAPPRPPPPPPRPSGERVEGEAAARAAPTADAERQAAAALGERLERLLVDLGARAPCPGPSVAFPAPCALIGFDIPPLPPFV